jgi:transcriptional regulator with XRE-family HTH domain
VSDDDLLAREQEVRELLRSVDPVLLGDRINRARKHQGLSMRDLARRAGIDKSSVVRLEGGSPPQPLTLIKVSAALGFHVATLVNGSTSLETVVAVHRQADAKWYDLADLSLSELSEADRRRASATTVILNSRLEAGTLRSNLIEVFESVSGQRMVGEEFVYVLDGVLRLTVGEHVVDLATGDSAAFWSTENHSYAPASESSLPVRVLCIYSHSKSR